MAENYDVSRNAIFKQIHIVTDKLKEYESILGLLEKRKKLENIIENTSDASLKKTIRRINLDKMRYLIFFSCKCD